MAEGMLAQAAIKTFKVHAACTGMVTWHDMKFGSLASSPHSMMIVAFVCKLLLACCQSPRKQ